jgi:hypothetical protein
MADLNSILKESLAGEKQSYLARDPYYLGGQGLMAGTKDVDLSDMNDGERLLFTIVRSLAGGGLEGYGQGRAEKRYAEEVGNPLTQILLSDNSAQAITEMPEFSHLGPEVAAYERDKMEAEKIKRVGTATDPELQALAKGLTAGSKPDAEGMGIDELDFNAMPVPLRERRDQRMAELRSKGFGNAQISSIIKDEFKPETAENTVSAKEMAKAEDRASGLTILAETAQEALDTADDFGPISGRISKAYATVGSLVSDTQEKELTAYQILETIKPDIVKLYRAKGSGALSDFESKALMGAGPQNTYTREANQFIINKLKAMAQLEEQYQSYLHWYRNTYGSVRGARTHWTKYKKDSGLLKPTKDDASGATLLINPNAPTWETWASGYFGGGGSTAASPQTTASDPLGIR